VAIEFVMGRDCPLHTAWTQYKSQLNMIRNFKIPRYVICKEEIATQVHGFSDASEKVYGLAYTSEPPILKVEFTRDCYAQGHKLLH